MTDSSADRYFEDYVAGELQEFGEISLSEAEIIDFARKYDPQDFHTDPYKAASGPYGGLIASGWQTVVEVMRLLVDRFLSSASSLGSPGIDELRWLAPVRPGDVLTVQVRVVDSRRSKSKPDRGLVHTTIKASNQDGVAVMTMKGVSVIACRKSLA